MIAHVPRSGLHTQLGWLFHVLEDQVLTLKLLVEEVPEEARAALTARLDGLSIGLETAEILASNFEEVTARTLCVVAGLRLKRDEEAILLAPAIAVLGERYTDSACADREHIEAI